MGKQKEKQKKEEKENCFFITLFLMVKVLQINKLWYFHAIIYYTAIINKGTVTMYTDLEVDYYTKRAMEMNSEHNFL